MTPNNSWLAMHINTALSHALQYPNSHLYRKDELEEVKLTDGKFYKVTEERRLKDLDRLIENLKSYKSKWDSDLFDDSDPNSHIVADYWERVQYVIELIQSMPVPTQPLSIKETS